MQLTPTALGSPTIRIGPAKQRRASATAVCAIMARGGPFPAERISSTPTLRRSRAVASESVPVISLTSLSILEIVTFRSAHLAEESLRLPSAQDDASADRQDIRELLLLSYRAIVSRSEEGRWQPIPRGTRLDSARRCPRGPP